MVFVFQIFYKSIFDRMERIVELSMWGNIAIEESLDVRHAGAKLKGTFSRYEFQKDNSGVSSVKSFKTVLPASGEPLNLTLLNDSSFLIFLPSL